MTMKERIIEILTRFGRPASIRELADEIPDKPESTIRGRLNEHVDRTFIRVARGIYALLDDEGSVLVIEGDGRDLSALPDGSIDAIITDHPWKDKATIGGSRNFTSDYDTFHYTEEDFREKARVLKDGAFLVEILPAENEMNYRYLYDLKQMAEACGFKYYTKVPWVKGTFVSNTGRKSKNTEDVLFMTKGKARPLRIDQKKSLQTGKTHYMSGTAGMLPTHFNVQTVHTKHRIHQAEKPIPLYEEILKYITLPGELVLDQFAGSGNLGVAAVREKRHAVLIELLQENVEKIRKRIEQCLLPFSVMKSKGGTLNGLC